MDRGLKERLVGAAVLVALAVIFIPMLLDDSPSGPGPITGTNIPAKPDEKDGFSSRIIPVKPDPVDVEMPPETEPDAAASDDAASAAAGIEQAEPAPESAPESAASPASEPTATEQRAADAPALSKALPSTDTGPEKPSGWVIQLGSFSQESNARDLDAKLRKAGYPAFVEPVTQSGKRVYRVRVGPEVMRGEAEKLRDRITAEFDIKGIVVSYP